VFAGVAVPAALVNSGLKLFQKRIQLAFMRRLTHNLHQHYTANRAYYAASTLGGAPLAQPVRLAAWVSMSRTCFEEGCHTGWRSRRNPAVRLLQADGLMIGI